MSKDNSNYLEKILKEHFKKDNEDNLKFGKILGSGAFGLVSEVIYKNKTYAAKLVKKEKEFNESDLVFEFKSLNIVKIMKIYSKRINDKESYNLILMEKASLKDLKTFQKSMHKDNILKLIIRPFMEGIVGDNLIRFYVRQLVKGLESLDRSDYSHFDIKPDNILIFINMVLKLTDFSLLRNPNEIKKGNKVQIPGGTRGYFSPEYYKNISVPIDIAKKQDFFALGSTIYYLKYGKPMLEYIEYGNNERLMTCDVLIDLLQRSIDNIQSQKLSDKDFKNFLLSLIKYNPDERPKFGELYRNKWLNKNSSNLHKIWYINDRDEEKLLLELNKSDYIIPKKKELKKNKKFIFKKLQ